ncbi:MAG: hypothetical protein IT379_39430 [Deltaproteobacteria bacterium]|nr:hypothetical protein [Deltaproteobacteria bacterium]
MSNETIRVVRVPGKVYPDPRPGRRFVGVRRALARELEAGTPPVVYAVPGGDQYVDDGPQELPNTREIRQALTDGDLALAPTAPAKSARGGREERTG